MKLSKLTIVASAAFSLLAVAQTTSPANPVLKGISAVATSKIESIEKTQSGAQTVVRFRMSEPLASAPKGFMLTNPSRIALDLPKLFEMPEGKLIEFNEGILKNSGAIQSNDKTRLLLNLRESASYEVRVEGRDLFVTLTPTKGAIMKTEATFAEGDANSNHDLAAFDFRRGPGGEGRVIVDMNDTSTGIDIKQMGSRIVVDFVKASAKPSIMKSMNVSDFGTLVDNVSIAKFKDGTRMTIEPRGDFEYSAYQADKRFVVEVKKRQEKKTDGAEGAAAGSNNFVGDKMSMNFQNVDVRNLLNIIADFTKLNIITSDSVQGKLTVRLQDVPWDQALDIILTTRGLDMRRRGSVIWVAPREEIAGFEKQALETAASTADLEPTRTEAFTLNYSKASDVSALLGNAAQKILSKRGSVVVDVRTNQLFVQDTSAKLEEVAGIIKKLDIPVRQVQIEARIVEARDSFGQSLGARLGVFNSQPGQFLGQNAIYGGIPTAYSNSFTAPAGSIANSNLAPGGGTPSFSSYSPLPQVNLPAAGLGTGATPSTFALTLLNSAATRFLSLEISAAEADGRGKIVSSPRVITGNQEKALIEQGTELPYQQAAASGATTVAFKKANLKLEVTPQITPDGNVIMAVDINKDAPGANTSAGFAIDTKHIQTKVLIENGGTVVIGGIYTQEDRTDVDKVPFLGDLPALGNLFRSTIKRSNKTELLIFLTPRILDDKVGFQK